MRTITLAFIIAAFMEPALGQGKAVKANVNDLAWMSGCWESVSRNGATVIAEQWMRPSGGAMLGMSRTVRNGKMSAYEFLRLVEDEHGINYISRPSQNKEDTAFRLTYTKPGEAVFENPAHDFPQKIIYRLNGTDLHARIEGPRNGSTAGVDFPMKRVKCE
jgi:hypothetical protein